MNWIALSLALSFQSFAFAQSWKSQVIEEAKNLYSPVALLTFNKHLTISINEDETLGASADHGFNELKVSLDKGLINSPRLTPDGLRMVICHELGHIFGGAPRRNVPMEWEGPVADDGLSLMSSEGQADYYASLVCFRKLVALESNNEPRPNLKRVGKKLKNKCEKIAKFRGKELDACLRAGLAGEDFLKLVFDFPISCEKEDTTIAPTLIRDSYPGRQCRLDTIVNGALCGDEKNMVLNFTDMSKNVCQNRKLNLSCWNPLSK